MVTLYFSIRKWKDLTLFRYEKWIGYQFLGTLYAVECPGGGTPELGILSRYPMKRIQTEIDTSDDQALVETITSLHQITLTDDHIVCIVCNESISDGEKITCYLLSPSGATGFDFTQCRCADHAGGITELTTLGAAELIVDAHIGRYRDEETGDSWPVLLFPRLRYVSEASTTTAREIDVDPYDDEAVPAALTDTAEKQTTEESEPVTEDTDWQTATLSRWEKPTEDDY